MTSRPGSRPAQRLISPLQDFLKTEISGGVILLGATIAALVWANASPGGYDDFWATKISFVSVGGFEASASLSKLVVDGLMAIFFFVVGMEIKRELTIGELAERRIAALAVFAAIGGMALPALIFTAINLGDGEAVRGWGIPMATDIAFALAALSLLRRWIPVQLAAFLLAVAVVDDIGAITVIALFYSEGISLLWLGAAAGGLALVFLAVRMHVTAWIPYALLGLLVWIAAYQSGVHATIAGVAMGLLMPVFARREPGTGGGEAIEIATALQTSGGGHGVDIARWRRLRNLGNESVPMLERFEHALHPWSSFIILPLFALSSAGIVIRSDTLSAAASSSISIGVVVGLVGGNIIGIPLGAFIATRLGLARLPDMVTWPHVIGAAAFAGIGFTVSIFVATLAYDDQALVDQAKLGILVASITAAVIGTIILRVVGRKEPQAAALSGS